VRGDTDNFRPPLQGSAEGIYYTPESYSIINETTRLRKSARALLVCVRLENGRDYVTDRKLEQLPKFVTKQRPSDQVPVEITGNIWPKICCRRCG
jgi:hypothetical protein